MPLLTFGGWSFGVPLNTLINQAMLLSRVYSFNHLGATVYYQNARIAEMVNWTVQKYLEANPDLALSSDTISMPNATTFGSNTVAIPATMYGQDVTEMRFTDSQQSPWTLNSQCLFLDNNAIQMLQATSPAWTNGTFTQRNPQYWSWDKTSRNQLFWPYPNDTTCQITRTFRVKPTPIVPLASGSMLSSGTTLTGTVTTVAGNAGVVGAGTAFLTQVAVNDYVTINEILYQVLTVTDNTHITLTAGAASGLSGAAIVLSTVIGEIAQRFNMMPAYLLAAYFCEDINKPKYDELMGSYTAAKADMNDQLTKQIASWNAGYSQQGSPNQLFSIQACFPYRSSGGFSVGV